MLKIQKFASDRSVVFVLSGRIETEKVRQLDTLGMKRTLVVLAAVLFTSCAQVATVRNIEPRAPTTANISDRSFPTEREARQDPEAALSQNLEIAATAWADLTRNPSNDRAVQVYNCSVGRIASLLQSTGKLPRAGAVTVGTGASAYKLTFTSDVKDFADPQTSHFIPADELAISGKYYTRRIRREEEGMEEVHRILLLNLTRAIAKGPVSGAYESEGLRSRQTARSSVFANFSRFCDIPRNWTAIAGPLAHALSVFQSGPTSRLRQQSSNNRNFGVEF
jgi:hypothetical protein